MVDRSKPQTIPLRPQVTWRTYEQINRQKCAHIDAWFIQLDDDRMTLTVEIRIGGRDLVNRATYLVTADSCEHIGAARVDGVKRYINTPWARKHAPYLEYWHKVFVQPACRIVPSGFTHNCVRLHYIWQDRRVRDPLAGIENLYSVTGREGRDLAQMSREAREAYELRQRDTELAPSADEPVKRTRGRPAGPWSKEQRSLLRSLDKLLK